MWPSCDILWKPGPEYSLSVQLAGNQSRKISARSSWFRYHTRRSPAAHITWSWMGEIWFPLRPFISARAKDEDKIEECNNRDSLISKQFMRSNLAAEENCSKGMTTAPKISSDVSGTFTERDYPIEEPWLLQSSLLSSDGLTDEDNIVRFLNCDFLESMSLNQSIFEDVSSYEDKSSDSHTTSSERDYPVEEPWLFQPSLLSPTSDAEVACDASSNEKSIEHETAEQEFQVPEKLFLDEESTITKALSASMDTTTWGEAHVEGSSGGLTASQPEEEEGSVALQDSVSTIILINSSLCTMQRIAVLEDGKLVELLLEPVKNNVQCDSVYLGAVTKLVPHMGGAFVNIGSPRPSLMDIRPNRKPFIFPPFRHRTKEREANGSVVAEFGEQPEVHENVHNSDDVEVIGDIEEHEIEDDALQYMRDDFEENEIEDDVDVLEDPKENVNGSVVDFEVEVDSERHLDQVSGSGHHIESQIISKILPLDTGFSHDSQHSHLKDVKNSKDQESKWAHVRKGTKIIVQVVKEGLGTKGPTLTAYPKLRSRFWVLSTCCNSIGISKKISGLERTRLRVIAKALQPPGYGLTVRTVAAGHSLEELQKDLEGLLSTWKVIMENAKSAALAADEGVEGAIPVLLHRAMGQTLSVVQDYFNDKVKNMIVDSPRTYHEVTKYLQDIAPDLCDRVELYNKRTPLFDEYNVEEELNNILSKRVPLSNGGYLVIEQTEALVSIDVNGGHCMLGQGTSQERAIFDVNLAAAKQIARELRLRDIGGIIVVDFIDMVDDSNKRLVYEEVKKAVERDRSMVKVSELSRHGLMEITRKRVRPSVTFMVSEPCSCCHATGRVEALETSFSKIEHEICRLLAMREHKAEPGNPKSWPKFILKVERYMCNYLTSGKRTRLAVLSSSLKVWILLKVARGFSRGTFELKPLTDDKDNKNHRVAISMLRPTTEVGAYTPKGKVTIFPIKKWKTGGK